MIVLGETKRAPANEFGLSHFLDIVARALAVGPTHSDAAIGHLIGTELRNVVDEKSAHLDSVGGAKGVATSAIPAPHGMKILSKSDRSRKSVTTTSRMTIGLRFEERRAKSIA